MPSSQTALCLLASMDPFVFSRSSRALFALAQTSTKSTKGLMLLVLEMAAIVEMLVGMSSREASASLALAWDEVLTGRSGPSGFWGGVMRTTAGVGLLGDDCSDSQLDASSTARYRRLLTSIVILLSNFGGDLCGLVIKMVETSPRGSIFWSGSSTGGEGISCYNGLIMPIQTYRIDNLWAGGKELADLRLADPPKGGPPPPLSEVGCPGACPWGVVCGEGPLTAMLGCKANQSHWRCRWLTSQLLLP